MLLPPKMPPRQTMDPTVASTLYDAVIAQGTSAHDAAGVLAVMVEACVACRN